MVLELGNLTPILFLTGNLLAYFKNVRASKKVGTLGGCIFLILLAIACLAITTYAEIPGDGEGGEGDAE